MADSGGRLPVRVALELPPKQQAGVHADFARVWHTRETVVLDFAAVKQPARPSANPETGEVDHAVLETRVTARIRIPAEQIFPLIQALRAQSDQWLAETGRMEPPQNWFPEGQAPAT